MFHARKSAFGSHAWQFCGLSHIEQSIIEVAAAEIDQLLKSGEITPGSEISAIANRIGFADRLVRPALKLALQKHRIAGQSKRRSQRKPKKPVGSAEMVLSDGELAIIKTAIHSSPKSESGFVIVDVNALSQKLNRSYAQSSRALRKACQELGYLVRRNTVALPAGEQKT